MPKITINERDLTSPGLNQSTSNAVFIPGYAVMGPINKPILCNTLDDFQATFGNSPYTFRKREYLNNAQNYPDYYFEEGSYERSYAYASEALKRGLPVIYSRIFNTTTGNTLNDNLTKWTAKATINAGNLNGTIIKAKSDYVGEIGESLYYTIQKPVLGGNNSLTQPTLLTIGISNRNAAPKEEVHSLVFKIQEQVEGYTTTYYKDIKSSLVDIVWPEGEIDEANIQSTPSKDNMLTPQNLSIDTSTWGAGINTSNTDEFTPNMVYDNLSDMLEDISDKGEYSLKFITSGAYPTFENITNILPTKGLDETMALTASERGDCIALIDAVPSTTQTASDLLTLIQNNGYGESGAYSAMFTPGGLYSCPTVNKQLIMPASFGYITSYATSVQNNPGWLAVAGASRGVVTNLISNVGPKITSAVVDQLQARNNIPINPITLIKPYGNLVWGNRTLKNNSILNNLTAQSFLNIRCLLCDLKKVIYTTAKGLTFEQNTDILWINFKAGIIPTLEQMVTGGGLSGYEIKRVRTTEKAKLKALIRLYAIEAVEDFDIDIELTDSEITTVE